ncbi:MAG: HEAT repeat domain-containing protein [Cyanobacteria bacterium P01_G01_bin.54]
MAVLTTEQIQIYWQSIARDQKLQPRRSRYVTTDVTGEMLPQASPETLAEGAIAPFALFADYDLELKVQERLELPEPDRPEAQREVAREPEPKKIETYNVLEGILKYAEEHVLLVGKPGSGKTTALERLLAEGQLIEGRLPIALRLRDLNPKADQPMLARLQLELGNRGLALGLEQVQDLLQQGQFLLLLDGINELPKSGLRRQVQDFRERYRATTPMIFTTRPLNVGVDLGIEKRLEMKPLSTEQMREFVQQHLGSEQGEVLLKQLGDRLRTFGETPLLLWMICGLFSKTGEIPANLGLAFRMFVRVYEEQKELAEERFWQSRFLQALAFAMMPQGGDPFGLRLQVSRQEAEEVLAQVLGISLFAASEKLTVLLSTHLLQVASGDELEFKHQLFQEYYAAECLLGQLAGLSDLALQKWYLNLLDWTEAVALVAGLVQTEKEAVRLVRLGLEVDLYWGSRLAGEVAQGFQAVTVGLLFKKPCWPMQCYECWPPAESRPVVFQTQETLDFPRSLCAMEMVEKLVSYTVISDLLKALEDKDSFVRKSVAEALGELGDEAAIPGLLKTLEDQDSSVRERAVDALGKLDSEAAVPGLIKALEDWDFRVRERAVDVLKKLGSEVAIPGLLQTLEHHDSDVRERAVEVLGELGSEVAIPGLLQTLEHHDSDVRERAVEALGKLGSEAAIPGLLQALTDQDSSVRWSATKGLEILGSPKPLASLWRIQQQQATEYLDEVIQTIQNRCKLYNYEISQLPLPIDQTSAPQTVQYDLRGAQIGNLANTVHGNQQTHAPQEPQP